MAAVLANAPAVASHYSAAWLLGLLRTRPSGAFHLTARTRRHAKRRFRVHFASLADDDLDVADGIPITALPRTLLDLAAAFSPAQLNWALERSEERRRFDLAPIDELLSRTAGHPGRGPLGRALAIYRPDPELTRSGVERSFRRLVEEAGLPRPSMNFAYAGYELDVFWPDARFAVELDVYETHGSRAAFERDRLRQEELKLIGVEMIRVTGPRLKREPKVVAERVAALLKHRRRELTCVN